MKEFTTAVAEVVAEDEREEQITALMAQGKTREEAEAEVDEDEYIPFTIDGRELHAYKPNEGQLVFLLASMGKGQSKQGRFASIVNLMLECLRDDDRDYMESRLLTRDRANRLPVKTLEDVFEYLVSEWFRSDVPEGGTPVRSAG